MKKIIGLIALVAVVAGVGFIQNNAVTTAAEVEPNPKAPIYKTTL